MYNINNVYIVEVFQECDIGGLSEGEREAYIDIVLRSTRGVAVSWL